MKIIILEGIATSGKTTVKNKLTDILLEKGKSFSVVEEDKTLLPILNNKDRQVSIDLLKKIINKALEQEKDYIIFDRLFFTHIFRTNSNINDFKEIEDMVKNQSLLVFLKIDESRIPERITYARENRDKSWDKYVSQKGNREEVFEYYINQQRLLLDLLKQTSLEYELYDTSDMDFEGIARGVLGDLK
jgi:thymidylate kinase